MLPPSTRNQQRRVRVLACEGCRTRRTRCDGNKPSCAACESRDLNCKYPEENKRTVPSVDDELAQIRTQLSRIERAICSRANQEHSTQSHSHARNRRRSSATSSWVAGGSYASSSASASPAVAAKDFPYMKIQTAAFTQLAGLGEDYGNSMVRLEQSSPLAVPTPTAASSGTLFVLQHAKVMAALQSFSAKIHPWYPLLEDRFSECVANFMANAFERGTDSFLVLMVLASGTIAQYERHSEALAERADVMYLNAAMEMLQIVILEQNLRSVQCLVAASIHYYLLLRPIQAHDFIMLAIKKAQNLDISGALRHDEHWIRVYRIALLIEGELVIPLRLTDSNAWETEEEVPLPTGTDIWSFEDQDTTIFATETSPASTKSIVSDHVITYLLAEIAMRRMLRRNTTAVTVSSTDGTIEYAPLIAKELETQLEQWFQFLPEPLRFSREFEGMHTDDSLQTSFLRTQYWACMVSFYWPSIVKVMDSQQLGDTTANGCSLYFKSYREFIKSATGALDTCLPNKWTIYASMFAISIGAYLGASTALLAPYATSDTWETLRLARDSFGEECRSSPSLSLMAESIRIALADIDDHM